MHTCGIRIHMYTMSHLVTLSVLSCYHSCIQWATRERPQETLGSKHFVNVVMKFLNFVVSVIAVELLRITLHMLSFCTSKCRFVAFFFFRVFS